LKDLYGVKRVSTFKSQRWLQMGQATRLVQGCQEGVERVYHDGATVHTTVSLNQEGVKRVST
jgi:hypothetical protein